MADLMIPSFAALMLLIAVAYATYVDTPVWREELTEDEQTLQ